MKSLTLFYLILGYLTSAEDEIIGDDLDAAGGGGVDGQRVIDLFLNELKNHLKDKGIIQLVQSSLPIIKNLPKLEEMGFKVEITASERFYLKK